MNNSKYIFLLSVLLLCLYLYLKFPHPQVPYRPIPRNANSTLCFDNPFLNFYNEQILADYELKWKSWSQTHFTNTFHYLKTYAQTSGRSVHDFPRIVYPSLPFLPCPSLARYGSSRDTGKQLCGLEYLSKDNCIVYSLGSNNDFQFEDALLSRTSCQIHTFDCTSSPPKSKDPRLTFHRICLGENTPLQDYIYPQTVQKQPQQMSNLTFMKFDQILHLTKHQRIHVLKMDIEGGEYSVFADLFSEANRLDLPFQLSFESHWWNQDIYHAILHMSLFSQLFDNGYRLLQYEINEGDRSCVEWTFLRVFCAKE